MNKNVRLIIGGVIIIALMLRGILRPDSNVNNPVAYFFVGLTIVFCLSGIGLAIYRMIKEKQAPQEQ